MEQYLAALDAVYTTEIYEVRAHLEDAVDLWAMDPDKTQRSAFLYGLLASLLKNRPLLMLKSIEQGNGYEVMKLYAS